MAGCRAPLRLQDILMRLRQPAQAETSAWRFSPEMGANNWTFRRGETLELELTNAASAPVNLNWYGLDGVAGAVPLLAQGRDRRRTACDAIDPAARRRHLLLRDADRQLRARTRPLPCGAFAVSGDKRHRRSIATKFCWSRTGG